MNRSVQNINIVKANLESIDDFEKASKHIEFKTVNRNGKTFVQRYNIKNLEFITEKNNTPIKAGMIDKIFHSFYHDGQFIDNEGKVLEVSDDIKTAAKGWNFEGLRREMERKILEGKGKTPEEITKTIKDTDKSRMEEFKKVKAKYEVNKEKQNEWLTKNKTRLTNQYEAIYSPEKRLSRIKDAVKKIDHTSNLNDLQKLFKYVVNTEAGDSLNNNKLDYYFNGKEYNTTVGVFKESINNRFMNPNSDKNKSLGIQNLKIQDLTVDRLGARTGTKTLNEYFTSAVKTAEQEGRIK